MRGRSERRRGPAAARGLVATRRTTEENKERSFPPQKIWLKLECEQTNRPAFYLIKTVGFSFRKRQHIHVWQLVCLD